MSIDFFKSLFVIFMGFSSLMLVAWLGGLKLNFISLVDAVWALGIGLGGAIISTVYGQNTMRSLFAGALALFWGLRLGGYLSLRLWRHFPSEDTRYQVLRKSWKDGFFWKTFLFFQFQAVTQVLFILPFMLLAFDAKTFPQSLEIVGASVAILGIFGEAISDSQMKRFKSDPLNRGKVCDVGLWRYSRHPNYFFEWIIWCGFALCALQAPLGWLALLCPIAMLFLLLFVTGVRPSEEQSLKSRGDLYREYQRKTSKFIPWFPREHVEKGGSHAH